jgi:predicted XRE-type DNA-binding protein
MVTGRQAGHQIDRVQHGQDPDDWKPMNTVGQGVREIRIRDASGAFRIIICGEVGGYRLCASLLPEEDREDQQTGPGLGRQALPRLAKGVRTMKKERHASVWDAIEDTPAEVENMKLRSELMTALKSHIARTKMSQAQAAKLFGVTQPRVSDLVRGKINLFGLDALVNMAAAAGLHVEMRVMEAA